VSSRKVSFSPDDKVSVGMTTRTRQHMAPLSNASCATFEILMKKCPDMTSTFLKVYVIQEWMLHDIILLMTQHPVPRAYDVTAFADVGDSLSSNQSTISNIESDHFFSKIRFVCLQVGPTSKIKAFFSHDNSPSSPPRVESVDTKSFLLLAFRPPSTTNPLLLQ
jgi:hypothetical protein